jgi:hypothetical protein
MDKDFEVGQSNELIKLGRIYDLHNCFDFCSLVIFGSGDIQILFNPNKDHGADYSSVQIHVQFVEYFDISPHFVLKAHDLEEIGYKSPGDQDDNWLLSETQASNTDDMFFRFNDGQFIRFRGKKVLLTESA